MKNSLYFKGKVSLVTATAVTATAAITTVPITATAVTPTVATAAAATTTITPATAATATFEGTATAAATAATAFFTGASNVHCQRTTIKGFAMELFNGALGFIFRAHRDEGKSTAFAREFVLHQQHITDGACLTEEVLQIGFRYVKGKVPNVKFII